MAGKTIEEACTVQDAAHNKSGTTSKPHNNCSTASPSVANDNSDVKTISINGKCYMLVTNNNASAASDGKVWFSPVLWEFS